MNQQVLDPRFRIRAPLRCDGVGSLDCAEDTESGVRMAVRWLPMDANGEAAVRAVGALPEHPVLPRIRQTGRVGQAAYVAMEFPEGRLLSTLEGEPLGGLRLMELATALSDALAALHEQGLVHGELSPESVLVLSEGRAILWDAPLVMANRLTDRRGEERAMAMLARVAPYLAPERARGLPPSASADVYALGSTLCTAAGGALPGGGTVLAVVHRIATLDWTPQVPAALPPAARVLVERMLAGDPARRPSARELAVAFAQVATAPLAARVEPASPAAPAPVPVPVTASKKPRALGAAVAALGVLLAVGTTAMLWPRGPAPLPAAAPTVALPEAAAAPTAPAGPQQTAAAEEADPDVGELLSPLVADAPGQPPSRRRASRIDGPAPQPPPPAAEPAAGGWDFLPGAGTPPPAGELKRP
jgi:hypothetical protein